MSASHDSRRGAAPPPLTVVRASGVAAASEARGSVVVIDVLRAFTTAAYAFASGAAQIVLVSTPEEALALRGADVRLVGEIGGRPIPRFDFGNSPDAIEKADLSNLTVVLRSSSGTQGVTRATRAERVFLGSLVVASATARRLREIGGQVTLLAMGSPSGPDGPEDEACADLFEALLAGTEPDRPRIVERVRSSPAGRQALDPSIDWITPGDLARALEVDRFGFCMPVRRAGGQLVAGAEPPLRSG